MTEFLAENNICGQTILQLISRGNAIVAELLRLKQYIPPVFKLENKEDAVKYADIILDFNYFNITDAHEHKIEHNEFLRDLDEQFRLNYIEIITRFYSTFESIHTFVVDLNHFVEDLEDGVFIHQTMQTVFADPEGKQLMCEAVYLYGVMLLIVDEHISGPVRERLLVSYYRYSPQRRDTTSCIDQVCKLLRDTGLATPKCPNTYPEDYFKRVTIRSTFLDMVAGKLRSDDIYNQLTIFPLPKHRSVALATQASMLYICLFFTPHVLHNQTAVMREIVDKYFPDNWTISIYMGLTVNLIETWDAFKAAKLALNNTLEAVNVRSYASGFGDAVPELLKTIAYYLKEGNLTTEKVLSDTNNITNVLRECNVTIRWLMLHTLIKGDKIERNKRARQVRELAIAESKYNATQVFKLLLHTAQFELRTKEILKDALDQKEIKWKELQKETFDRLTELSDVFSGAKPLMRIEKNTNLQHWFGEISREIDLLDQEENNSGRKIVQLIQALEEVQEFHQLGRNMQVVQCLAETRTYLHQMLRSMDMKEDTLITLQIIADVSYAWELIESFTSIMQSGIKREPSLCMNLRAVFLKLASALEIPLLRINQAHSEDLISVSHYYSGELEIYIRKVLQIIPESVFEKMWRIIQMQTTVLKEVPTRLEKDKLKEYAQLNERFEFAALTNHVSVFSEGMRMMKTTLVGAICLDAKQLLEDGMRKELVGNISGALHKQLIFTSKGKVDELEHRIKMLAQIMNGYKRSFEYIQDYVNINGLKIWQEEVTRIINYNVEQECNLFLRNKVHAWQSKYQSRYVPIPQYPPVDNTSNNFIGRLAQELIRLTDPRNSLYVQQTFTWYDLKTQAPIINKKTFALILSAIEITGLVGLDRLFSFMIITDINTILDILENKRPKNPLWENTLRTIITEVETIEENPNLIKFCQNCTNRTSKLWSKLIGHLLHLGQLQLLRNMVTFQLSLKCNFDAKNLQYSLKTVNSALLNNSSIKNGKCVLSEKALLSLSHYFEWTGMTNPFNKIYVTPKPGKDCPTILFIFLISNLSKMLLRIRSNQNKRTQDLFDGVPLVTAFHTILKQFHPRVNKKFIEITSQFILGFGSQTINGKSEQIPMEILNSIRFLEMMVSFSQDSMEHLLEELPEELLHLYNANFLS